MNNDAVKNDIRLIALDLDGTVLTDEKTITPRTAAAIAAAAERGLEVVPVTGRPLSGLPEDLLRIPGIRYIIASNGAITAKINKLPGAETRISAAAFEDFGKSAVCTAVTEYRSLRSEYLDPKDAKAIARLCLERGLTFNIFIDGIGYALPDSCARLIERFTGTPLDDYVRKSRRVTESIPALLRRKGRRVENIWIKTKDQAERDEINSLIRKYTVNTVLTAPTDIEVGSLLADKGRALTALAEHLGIQRSQILAIGDNDNDLGMLRAAGTAVAMGNATPAVKAMADLATASNQEDGVAEVLEKLLSNNLDIPQFNILTEISLGNIKCKVNIEKTQKYYRHNTVCGCDACKLFSEKAAELFPELARFLSQFGADITSPDETCPVDMEGYILYTMAGYTICGKAGCNAPQELEPEEIRPYKVHICNGFSFPNSQDGEYFSIEISMPEIPLERAK